MKTLTKLEPVPSIMPLLFINQTHTVTHLYFMSPIIMAYINVAIYQVVVDGSQCLLDTEWVSIQYGFTCLGVNSKVLIVVEGLSILLKFIQ